MAFTKGSSTKASRDFIKFHFSPKVVAKFDQLAVAMDCVNTEYEGEIADAGDLVSIREFGNIAWSDYTVDQTITYATLTESSQDLVIDQQKYFAFKVDDIDQHQSDLGVMDGHAERAAISGRNIVDDHIISGMISGAHVINQLGAASDGNVLDVDAGSISALFGDLFTLLSEAEVFSATNETPFAILTPRLCNLIKQSPELTHATAEGDKMVRSNVIGMFRGFETKESTSPQMRGLTSNGQLYETVIVGVTLGYTFAMQINEVEEIRLETTFGDGMRGLMVYGSKAILPKALAVAYVAIA